MKMTRTVYHIAGTDYQENNHAELTFNVQCVSIQNFLTLSKRHSLFVVRYSPVFKDYQPTYTDGNMKSFTLRGLARCIVRFAEALGKKEWSDLDDKWFIRNSELRAYELFNKVPKRYNGFQVYDPASHTWAYKSNSPVKVHGIQALIGGKLWRKYNPAPPKSLITNHDFKV